MSITRVTRLRGRRGFGDGGATLPSCLLAAVIAFLKRSPTATRLTGGIHGTRARDRATMPYAVVRERHGNLERTDSNSDVTGVTLEIRLYAADQDQAGSLGDELARRLDMGGGARFVFRGGTTTQIRSRGEPRHEEETKGRAPGGSPRWYQTREWFLRVIRIRSD